MITPNRAIIINHASPSGFCVSLSPPNAAQSSINAVCDSHIGAVQYAEGAAAILQCPVIDCTDVAGFDGVAEVVRDLRAYLPTLDDLRAMGPHISTGPSLPVPVVFVHILIAEVERLRDDVGRLETAMLMTTPAGAA